VASATSITTYCWGPFIYVYSSSAPTGVGRSRGASERPPPFEPHVWYLAYREGLPVVLGWHLGSHVSALGFRRRELRFLVYVGEGTE
jgi:hypothetical protein